MHVDLANPRRRKPAAAPERAGRPHSLAGIEARLAELGPLARSLEPDPAGRRALQDAVLAYGERFLDSLEGGRTFNDQGDGSGLDDFPVQESGRPIDEILGVLERDVDGPGLNPASPGHLGYIPGGGLYPASLGDYLAAVANRYAGVHYVAPGAVRMENGLLRWMAELAGYPADAGGDLTSGGSLATLTAVVAARDAKGVGPGEVERSVVYASPHQHHCLHKALVIAGLRDVVCREVALDARYRMAPDDLARQVAADRRAGLRPFMATASAGTTDVGAVDPIGALADVASAEDLWLHVDAAYGGFFKLCPEAAPLLGDLGRTDSIVLDPHKGLFLPYGSGAVLVRDREALYRAMHYQAAYLQDAFSETPSPADYSVELSRHFRGMRLWLPLQLFGLAPFRAALSEKIWLARYFRRKAAQLPHVRVGPEPDLSVAVFRWEPPGRDADEANLELVRRIHADGRVFLTSSTIDGRVWMRAAVVAFRTHKPEVDRALDVIAGIVGG